MLGAAASLVCSRAEAEGAAIGPARREPGSGRQGMQSEDEIGEACAGQRGEWSGGEARGGKARGGEELGEGWTEDAGCWELGAGNWELALK